MTPLELPKNADVEKELLASIDPQHGSAVADLLADFSLKDQTVLRRSFGSHSSYVEFKNAKGGGRVVRFAAGKLPYAKMIAEDYWKGVYGA